MLVMDLLVMGYKAVLPFPFFQQSTPLYCDDFVSLKSELVVRDNQEAPCTEFLVVKYCTEKTSSLCTADSWLVVVVRDD